MILLASLCATGALAQDSAPLPESSERWRVYLERQPFHERAFEELVVGARAVGGLDALVARYEARMAAEPDALAPRVVLARLLAASGETARARALLEPLAEAQLEACVLLARMDERAGDPAAAAERFGSALALCADGAERAEVLAEQADALRLAGARAEARVALLELAELERDDFAASLEAAQHLEAAEFSSEAIEVTERALELAGDDAPRAAQALAVLGERLEAVHQGARALEAYDRACALLGQGHWMRAELFDRAAELRAAAGTLEPWLAELRARAEAERALAPRLDLARALEMGGRPDEALEALLAARAQAPDEEALDARVLALAERAGRGELVVAEWRRRVERQPDEIDARLALAAALRDNGEPAAADRELIRADELSTDVGERLAIARRLFAAGRLERARATLERAAAGEEGGVEALLELARVCEEAGDPQSVTLALNQAKERAEGPALLLVARARVERGEVELAARVLERAAEHEGLRGEASAALASLRLDAGDLDGARAAWRARAAETSGVARSSAVESLAASYEGARAGLVQEQAQEQAQDGVSQLVQARLHRRLREHDEALRCLQRYLELEADDEAARGLLIDALVSARRLDDALTELDTLEQLEPRARSAHRLRRSDLLRRAHRPNEALAALAGVRADAHRQPELLHQLAARYEALGQRALAIEALEHARRLDPGDGKALRALGRLLAVEHQAALARARLLEAWRQSASPVERAALAAELHEAFEDDDARRAEIDALTRRVDENPYDREAPALLLELLPLQRRYAELERVAALLLERRGEVSEWRFARGRARLGLGRVDEGLADLEALVVAGATREALASTLGPELAMHRDAHVAGALGPWVDDPMPLARALLQDGHIQVTADLLSAFGVAHGLAAPGLLDLLLELREHLREPAFAIQVLEAAAARDGLTIVLAHRIGGLHHQLGNRAESVRYGKELIELGAPDRLVESYFERKELADELASARGER